MRTTIRKAAAATGLALVLAACGSGDGGGDGIATLGDGDGVVEGDDGGGSSGGSGDGTDFDDAVLEFAQCMRDQGIDFPDPELSGDGGGLVIAGPTGPPGDESPQDMAALEAAHEACEHLLADARGSMPRPSPEEEAQMRDDALAFAECMRDNGVEDFPDPEFGEGGRIGIRIGGPGMDPSDPAFEAAQEACGEQFGFAPRAAPAGGGG